MRLILHQHGDGDARVLLRDLAHTHRVGADHGICHQNILRTGLARDAKLQTRRALELRYPSTYEHAHNVAELCGLDMWSPAICIATEKLQGGCNVVLHAVAIDQQRRRQHACDVGKVKRSVAGKRIDQSIDGHISCRSIRAGSLVANIDDPASSLLYLTDNTLLMIRDCASEWLGPDTGRQEF